MITFINNNIMKRTNLYFIYFFVMKLEISTEIVKSNQNVGYEIEDQDLRSTC